MAVPKEASWAAPFLLLSAFFFANPPSADAQGDHRLVWRTLATEHFEIHYHEPLGLLARHLASKTEAIHGRLRGSLGLDLAQRVQLVLLDEDDAANGSATPVPYNAIRLRAVAPDDLSPLTDYDDWPTLLLTHEHTHILHLEQASGIPLLLRRIFGRSSTPQGSLPAWFVEGLATLEETTHTSAGRGRSAMFDMFLRMDALEDRILELDWVSHDGEPWPHGQVRYAYGQAFVTFVAERFGQRALGKFIEEYGRRLVPYGLNRALRRATGHSFVELYRDFKVSLRERAARTRAAVEARGVLEGRRLTYHGEASRSPRFLSNDELAYSVADARHVPDIRIMSTAGAKPEQVTETTSVVQLAPTRDRQRLVYSAFDYHLGNYFFEDLFLVARGGGRPTRLTHGLRAREPDVSPDGHSVAYVVHGAGTSHLELAELKDVEHTRRTVVRSQFLEQIYTPRFSPDGTHIAYSAWSRGGYRDLWVVSLANGARERITYDRAIDRSPAWAPDGKTLYFSSDRSGIANIYAYSLENHTLRQVTNVVGGAVQVDVAPDGRSLVYVGYTKLGFDLFWMPLDPARTLEPAPALERPPAEPLLEPAPLMSHAYSPWFTLLPRAYSVALRGSGDDAQLELSTSGRDAVGIHAWTLTTSLGIDDRPLNVEAGYAYQRARLPALLSGRITRFRASDLVVNERNVHYDALSFWGTLGTSIRFPYGLRSFALRPDYGIGYAQASDALPLAIDPNYAPPAIPTLGRDARLSLTVAHSSAQRQPYDISRSWGHSVSWRSSLRRRRIGSARDDFGTSFRAEQFQRLPFREAVLALAYTGAWNLPVTVGGLPSQALPVFDAFTGNVPAPADVARLRGFPLRSGRELSVLQLEARMLIVRINRGASTLPLFARRVHCALFSDVGEVGDRALLHPTRPSVGVGGELRLDGVLSYDNELTLRLGVARGLTALGETQWYASFARPY